jgi:hypothetical protein
MAASAEPSADTSPSHQRAPDFFIVGAPKTGTTSLYKMLGHHPQIYLPELKEPLFLAGDMQPLPDQRPRPGEPALPQTMEAYLALFAQATPQQRVGEASTFYLWSRTAAERIADLQPGARIVAILREPASFLRSMHLMLLGWGVEGETDLRKAIALEATRREGRQLPRHSHRPQLLLYSDHVRYLDQLGRFRARFPPEQILVLIYDDFQSDNEGTVRRVLGFLGVDADAPVALTRANVTRQSVRSPQGKYLMHSLMSGQGPAARSTKAIVRALTTERLRYSAGVRVRRLVRGEAPPADERLMLELRRRYKPEVQALGEHLGRDLVSLWGYDRLD